MSEQYSIENVIEIWQNDIGYHFEIGLDRDCFGLVEIREYNENDKIINRIHCEKECAIKIANSILKFCNDEKNFEDA